MSSIAFWIIQSILCCEEELPTRMRHSSRIAICPFFLASTRGWVVLVEARGGDRATVSTRGGLFRAPSGCGGASPTICLSLDGGTAHNRHNKRVHEVGHMTRWQRLEHRTSCRTVSLDFSLTSYLNSLIYIASIDVSSHVNGYPIRVDRLRRHALNNARALRLFRRL